MAAFRAQPKHEQREREGREAEHFRVLPLKAPPRPRPTADPRRREHSEQVARTRGESAPGTGISLTLAFLVAGLVILAAIAFWSGPEKDVPDEGTSSTQSLLPGP